MANWLVNLVIIWYNLWQEIWEHQFNRGCDWIWPPNLSSFLLRQQSVDFSENQNVLSHQKATHQIPQKVWIFGFFLVDQNVRKSERPEIRDGWNYTPTGKLQCIFLMAPQDPWPKVSNHGHHLRCRVQNPFFCCRPIWKIPWKTAGSMGFPIVDENSYTLW